MPQISSVLTCRRAALLSVCGLLVFSVSSALADGVIRDGLGAISSGRGGTNIAHSDNGAILLDNPASLVNIERNHLFEISGDLLICDLNFSQPLSQPFEDDAYALVRPFALPQLSFIRKSDNGNWAFGLGVYAPAGFGAEFDLNNPVFGMRRYRSLGALIKRILPGIAYRLTDRLSVGGTLGVAASHVELEGPCFLQSGPLVGAPALLNLQATGAALTWSLGLQYELSDQTTLGLVYQSESRLHMDGRISADVFVPEVGIASSRFDALVDITWPRSVGLGVKHQLCPHQTVSADVIWFDWPHAFDTIGMRLTDPSNPMFTPFGPICDNFPLRWRDSVSVRVGYERSFAPGHTGRMGYAFHPNPIPDGTLTPYIPAILEHAFSVGYGRRWSEWQVDLAYQFSFGPDRTVTASDFVGGDFDSSSVTARAHWIFVSLSRQR